MWSENYGNPHQAGEHPEGELAAFALNALDDAEFQAVFHHVIQCPHCQEVLLGFQETSARLAGAVPETPLPPDLKGKVLAGAMGRAAPLPPADARWSLRRLRRWLTPVAIGALSLLLAVSVGVITLQQREISELTATVAAQREQPAAAGVALAAAPASAALETADRAVQSDAATSSTLASASSRAGYGDTGSADRASQTVSAAQSSDAMTVANAEEMDQMKQEMAEFVEATVLSAQPETEKVPMSSPMGTEPAAKGVLMVEPSGRRGVLMVSGMPADSYQIWLVRSGRQVMVDRVVVNDDDGTGVKQLELDESIFQFQQVALMPDERHGPTKPTGEQFLSALIMPGPPLPPR